MSYKVHFTKAAERDLNEAVDYIDYVLKNPAAGDHLLNLTEEKLTALVENPKIYSLVDDKVLKAWEIRFVTVKNYLAFFTIDESCKTVYIIRFLLCRRNWSSILKQPISLE